MIKRIKYSDTYQLRHEVMWPNKPMDFIKVTGDEDAFHYGLYIDNDLVSVISLFIENDRGQFRKFATKVECQGKGYGTKLLNFIIEEAKLMGLSQLICNARLEKTDFYERFGMKKTEKTFEKAGKEYVIMAIDLKEK